MEKEVENIIDSTLSRAETPLYWGSLIGGIILVIVGIVLISSNKNKKNRTIGYILLTIGILASISGGFQLFGL